MDFIDIANKARGQMGDTRVTLPEALAIVKVVHELFEEQLNELNRQIVTLAASVAQLERTMQEIEDRTTNLPFGLRHVAR